MKDQRKEKIEEMMREFNKYIKKALDEGDYKEFPNAQCYIKEIFDDFCKNQYAYDLED